jgi:lysophospholipase L1-like esterase
MQMKREVTSSKTLAGSKKFLFSVITVVIGLGLVEGGLHLIHFVTHRQQEDFVTRRASMSMFRGKDWANQYWVENQETSIEYQPFYGWAREKYDGHFTNVDSAGLRKTWNPPAVSELDLDTLLVFGGSTLWGSGARDDHTIPSELSRMLFERGYGVYVQNYGETGHTFTQELVRLILLLRDGHRPDYVIFYDGVNDVYSAYQSGVVGSQQNVSDTRNRLRRKTNWEMTTIGLGGLFQEHSMIYRAAAKLVNMFDDALPVQYEVASKYKDKELLRLASDISDSHSQTIQLLDSISKAYGFGYLCFWQPVAFTEKHLSDEEAQSDPRLKDVTLEALYRHTLQAMQNQTSTRFFTIADALKDRTASSYFDFCHLSEEGNQIVAEKILETIVGTFPLQKQM